MWKEIEGFPDYEVSDTGQVRSIERTITDSRGHAYCLKERLLKPYHNKQNGYLYVTLRSNGKNKNCSVHRLVASAYLNKRAGDVVNHKDGDKTNNNVGNLEFVSYSYNNQAAYDTGLKPKGEQFYNHKLTREDVTRIRNDGKYSTYENIALNYQVSKATIRDALLGRTWK